MTVLLSRRFWGLLAMSWAVLAAGWLMASVGLVAVGLVGGLAWAVSANLTAAGKFQGDHHLGTPRLVESDRTPVLVELSNPSRRRRLVEWRLELPGLSRIEAGSNTGLALLPPAGQMKHELGAIPLLFGLHRVGPLVARSQDPLGLTAVDRELSGARDVRVHPKRDPLSDPVVKARQKRTLIGAYEVSQQGYGFEFYGLRDYTVGDRPRDVNWKASGRVGRLIINQREKENDTEVVLLVDIRAASGVGLLDQSPFAQGCRLALAVAESHLRNRDAVRFVAFGSEVHEDRHTGAVRHLRGIQDLVIGLEPGGSVPLIDTLHHILPSLRRRSPVILISPLVGDPSVTEAAALLGSHGFHLQCVVPRPTWNRLAGTETARRYEAAQDAGMDGLRRLGIPTAELAPGAPFAAPFVELQVRA